MLHDRAELRRLHEAVSPTTARRGYPWIRPRDAIGSLSARRASPRCVAAAHMEMNHTLPGKTAVDRALASADSSWSADWRSLIVATRRSDMLHLWCDCIELGVNLRIAAMPTDAPHYTSCTDTKTRPALSHLGCRPAPTRAGRQPVHLAYCAA
jgi:hypothetical protein